VEDEEKEEAVGESWLLGTGKEYVKPSFAAAPQLDMTRVADSNRSDKGLSLQILS
jgi:hypothetical protein